MSYFKYLKKYWKLIVMNSVVHIYQRFYSIPLWCSWKVVQNLPGRFCDKRSVWQCHMIAWWTEKNLKSFFTTLYMGSLSMAFIVGIQSCHRFRWSYVIVKSWDEIGIFAGYLKNGMRLFKCVCICFSLRGQLFWRRNIWGV